MQNATKTHRLQLELPESVILLIQEVKFPSLDINQRIRLSIAIDLFTQGSVSLAKAAELAEMHIYDFIGALKIRGIYAYQYTEEEFKQDQETIKRYKELKKNESSI